MYDRSLGSAMNYGNIGPKQKKNPYTRWQDQESALNDGFEIEGNAPSVVPKVKDTLDRAILRNPQRDSALSNLYQQSAATQPQQTTPIAQTGYQARYFTPTGNTRESMLSPTSGLVNDVRGGEGLPSYLTQDTSPLGTSQQLQQPQSQQGASYPIDPAALSTYLAGLNRRGEGAGGFKAGAGRGFQVGAAAAPMAGPWAPLVMGAGALIGGIAGAFTKNAPTAATDLSLTDAQQAITMAYRNLLGRDPEPGAIQTQLTNIGWKPGHEWVGEEGLAAIINSIASSPEASQLSTNPQGSTTPTTSTSAAATTQPTSVTSTSTTATPLDNAITGQRTGWCFTSPTGGSEEFQYTPMNMGDTSQFEGFNFDNRSERDLNSAKYIFAQFASQIDVTQPDAIQRLVALMNEHGVPARQVGPDSIDMGLGEGPMDVIRGGNPEGGIPNIAWQWIPGAGSPGGMANQLQQKTLGALSPLQGAITGGDNNVLAQILAMLQGQLGGQGTK